VILAQACHSFEEYRNRLYDVLAPARYVSGLISDDHRIGFVIFNAALVAAGLWCYLGPIRRGRPSARAIAWAWVVLESANGTVHILWALLARAYRPGLYTVPLLIASASILAWRLRAGSRPPVRA